MIIPRSTCSQLEGWRFTIDVDPFYVDTLEVHRAVAPGVIRELEDRFPALVGALEDCDVEAVTLPVDPTVELRQVRFGWRPAVTAARFAVGGEEVVYQLAVPRTPVHTASPGGKQLWEWSGWDTESRCWVYKVRP